MIKFFIPMSYIPKDYISKHYKAENNNSVYCLAVNIPDKCPKCEFEYVIGEAGSEDVASLFIKSCLHVRSYPQVFDIRIEQRLDIKDDGSKCDKCYEWTPMAIANMTNNKFRCYRCRTHPLVF